MKFINTFFIFLFIFCFFNAFTQNEQTNQYSFIIGNIVEYDAKKDSIEIKIIKPDYLEERIETNVDFNSDGSFYLSLYCPVQQEIILIYDQYYTLLINPGDTLYLQASKQDNEQKSSSNAFKIKFIKGKTAKFNNKLLLIKNKLNEIPEYHNQTESIKTLGPLDFKLYVDSFYDQCNIIVDEFVDESNLSIELKECVLEDLKFEKYDLLLNYSFYRMFLTMQPPPKSVVDEYPSAYFEFFEDLKKISLSKYKSDSYFELMNTYYKFLTYDFLKTDSLSHIRDLLKNGKESEYYSKMVNIIVDNSSGELKQILLSKLYNSILKECKFEIFDEVYKTNPITVPYLKEELENQYALYSRKLETNSNIIVVGDTSILNSIINQYEGKVIYIDIWTTWCKPCIAALKNADQIYNAYDSTQVVFVNICVQSSRESWENRLKKDQLGGVHIFIGNEYYKYLETSLNIKKFPTCLIVDQQGNIVNTDPPKPDDYYALKKVIDALLK